MCRSDKGNVKAVCAVGLTLVVHYYVEPVKFLVKEPNLCEIVNMKLLKRAHIDLNCSTKKLFPPGFACLSVSMVCVLQR